MITFPDNNPFDLSQLTVLVVDDQADVRRGLKRLLRTKGCEVSCAESAEKALDHLAQNDIDLVLTDLKMGGMSGVQLLHEINKKYPDVEVVLITGHGTIAIAVECLQNGASNFITKPFDNNEILDIIRRTGYRILSRKETQRNQNRFKSGSVIAIDKSMRAVLELVDRVARSKVPVLIEGESGTGKEMIAREVHARSKLSDKPFVAINCIALPDSLIESELFGYKRGAFTGAHQDTKGLFEQANGGTIFLDEISGMSHSFQGKLLRVLQEKVVKPLGSMRSIPVDFRLIAASNQNLKKLVEEGKFREDLYFRLDVVNISLPRLRERLNCIPPLAEYFLKRSVNSYFEDHEFAPSLAPSTIRALKNYDWPGNVRELENTIQRALIVCNGPTILPVHLGFNQMSEISSRDSEKEISYEEGKQKAIEKFQQEYIEKLLVKSGGNITHAAEICGLTRAALQRIMRKLNIEKESLTLAK